MILPAGALLLTFCFLVGCAAERAERRPMAIPSVTAPRYVLLRAADVMDTPSKAPYVWVEEANVPVALICRNPDVIAPVSVAIKYLPAPRGGTISPWQGGAAICHVRIGPD